MSYVPLLFLKLPLGLDTLGVSISVGIKTQGDKILIREGKSLQFPTWLSSAVSPQANIRALTPRVNLPNKA